MNRNRPPAAGLFPASPPPRLPTEVLEARTGYHRLLLAMTLALLCACFLLPAPDNGGQVRLPGLDTPLPTLCMLKRECGIDCPGCGLTRCFLSMGHAKVTAAWGYHPVGVLLFAVLVAQIPYRLCQIWRLHHGHREWNHWALRALLWLLVVAILAQWILRMIVVLSE